MNFPMLERDFFRALNAVVEPAVRRGLASPRYWPTGLIVLETEGYKTGKLRRTPLMSVRLGKFLLVATARGNRSFWPRNIERNPSLTYYRGGRSYAADAILVQADGDEGPLAQLPGYMRRVCQFLQVYTQRGWKFAVLT